MKPEGHFAFGSTVSAGIESNHRYRLGILYVVISDKLRGLFSHEAIPEPCVGCVVESHVRTCYVPGTRYQVEVITGMYLMVATSRS